MLHYKKKSRVVVDLHGQEVLGEVLAVNVGKNEIKVWLDKPTEDGSLFWFHESQIVGHSAELPNITSLGTLGERLAYSRNRAHLTQAQAGAALSLSTSAIGEIERNKNETSIANVAKLSDLYHVDFRWLADGTIEVPEMAEEA